jgi:hypothetical protein
MMGVFVLTMIRVWTLKSAGKLPTYIFIKFYLLTDFILFVNASWICNLAIFGSTEGTCLVGPLGHPGAHPALLFIISVVYPSVVLSMTVDML